MGPASTLKKIVREQNSVGFLCHLLIGLVQSVLTDYFETFNHFLISVRRHYYYWVSALLLNEQGRLFSLPFLTIYVFFSFLWYLPPLPSQNF